ncbi:MAG TPA: ABC transporter substrate-binding protein [Micromonosporaceae bacterium]|nr:ABC transporter substrate-binding protein [Micromonosporaceae bacterium]
MRKFACRLTAALLLASTGIAGCGSNSSDPADRPPDNVVYLTSFGNFGRDAYAWVAHTKGFFADRGIEVEIRPGTGTDGVKLVAAGKAHFAVSDFSGGLMQVSHNNLDVRAVALIHQRSLAAIMALSDGGIRTPKDLEGRAVADLPASVIRMLFPTYAKLAGINADKVRFVNATPQTLPSLLGTGSTDAIGQFVVGKPTIEAITKKPVVLLPYSDHLIDLPGNALWAAADTDPDLVRRFRDALLDGLRYALTNPAEAGQLLAAIVPGTNPDTAAAELELMRPYVGTEPLGTIDPARIARTIALLQAAGAIRPGLTPEQVITSDAKE